MQTSPKLIHSSELHPEQLLLWRREWIQFSHILEVKRGLTGPGSSSASFWSRRAKTAGKWTQPCILLFFKPLCGSWAVCSVAPHWLKMSTSQWTQALAPSYVSLRQQRSPCLLISTISKGERCGAGCWPTVTSWGNACRQPLFGANCLLTRVTVTRSPASPVSWLLLDETKHLLLLSPTFRTFCLVVFACDVTSENPAWLLKELNEGCDASTSASPFLSLSAVLSQPSTPYLLVPHLIQPLSFCVHV